MDSECSWCAIIGNFPFFQGTISSIGNGGTSAVLDGANSLPIVLFKKWGKSLGIKMEFFETALVLD